MKKDKKKIAAWIGIGAGLLAAIGIASAFKKEKEFSVGISNINLEVM